MTIQELIEAFPRSVSDGPWAWGFGSLQVGRAQGTKRDRPGTAEAGVQTLKSARSGQAARDENDDTATAVGTTNIERENENENEKETRQEYMPSSDDELVETTRGLRFVVLAECPDWISRMLLDRFDAKGQRPTVVAGVDNYNFVCSWVAVSKFVEFGDQPLALVHGVWLARDVGVQNRDTKAETVDAAIKHVLSTDSPRKRARVRVADPTGSMEKWLSEYAP